MTVFFTSDTHWGHRKIIQYCNRPFQSVEQMDEALIENWNARVTNQDDVWHLGDFAFATVDQIERIIERLNGNIHLVFGNHDDEDMRYLPEWASVQDYAEINIDGARICLFHYAQRVWNNSHRGSYHLYGHTHNQLPPTNRSLDVGVDAWNYAPVTFDEIRARLGTLTLDETPEWPPKPAWDRS